MLVCWRRMHGLHLPKNASSLQAAISPTKGKVFKSRDPAP